jgi:hypothetical protein
MHTCRFLRSEAGPMLLRGITQLKMKPDLPNELRAIENWLDTLENDIKFRKIAVSNWVYYRRRKESLFCRMEVDLDEKSKHFKITGPIRAGGIGRTSSACMARRRER